jgi:hypothetical protein
MRHCDASSPDLAPSLARAGVGASLQVVVLMYVKLNVDSRFHSHPGKTGHHKHSAYNMQFGL